MASTAAATACSMPRLRAIGFAPAATLLIPWRTIARARTVAVVVPSPATSLVLVATSLASWAPMFSHGSSSSTSLAMVTPSLVMVGRPTSCRGRRCGPSGPRVIETASASLFTPASRPRRASSSNFAAICDPPSSGTVMGRLRAEVDDGEHVARGQDEVLVPSTVTSVPPYFEYMTVSPTLMPSGMIRRPRTGPARPP